MNQSVRSAGRQGFTLVELLVVLTILILLAIAGMVLFMGTQKGARDAKRKGDIDAIANVLEVNKQFDGYPALVGSFFAEGVIPQEGRTEKYCIISSQISPGPYSDPDSLAWEGSDCPPSSNYFRVDESTPVANAVSWKICALLESEKVYCKISQQ